MNFGPLFRFLHLGLLACVVVTTALGTQPKSLVSAQSEQETEADSPTEESGEEEVESTNGVPCCRRGTLEWSVEDFGESPHKLPRQSPRTRSLVISPRRFADHNGFGGNMRL